MISAYTKPERRNSVETEKGGRELVTWNIEIAKKLREYTERPISY